MSLWRWLWLLLALGQGIAQGAVSLTGTRLIFDGRFREATIDVSNLDEREVLIQAWISDPQVASSADLPFALTPHLARLPAKGKQPLRLLYEGVGMPGSRESLLHLYVLEVPRRHEGAQQLNIAIRQRINVFYRPAGLPGDPAEAAQRLNWRIERGGESRLVLHNPTPFHVVLQGLTLDGVRVAEDLLVEPLSQRSLPLVQAHRDGQRHLTFKALTDYGGQRDYCAQGQGERSFNAQLRAPDAPSYIGKC
ncbi:molecular chaperone [Pseudomonas sp. NPDC090202]|uniref:fimbrial biogenesis chaperone n=1 Tax=unclassified Pseudomonas TaxID=196821 RepID=UPI00381A1CDA